MHVLLARSLGKTGYGAFSYTLSIVGILAVFAPMGWGTALMRFIAEYHERKQFGLLKGAIRFAHLVTICASLLGSAFLLGIAQWSGVAPDMSLSLRFAAVLLPFAALSHLRRKALNGLMFIKGSIVPEEIILPMTVIALVLAMSLREPAEALLAYTCAAAGVLVIGWVILNRALPTELAMVAPEYSRRVWSGIAFMMLLGSLSQIVLNQTDIVMIGALAEMDSVGLYSASNRIASVNVFVLGSVNMVASPMLAAAFHGGRRPEFWRIFRQTVLASSAFAVPVSLTMFWMPEVLLGFFGEGFTTGSSLLRVLVLGQLINALTGPVGFALLMAKRERAFAWSMGIAAMANVLGNYIAVPLWGAFGAACVTASTVGVLNLTQLFLSRRIKFENTLPA